MKTDEELIDYLMECFYSQGSYGALTFYAAITLLEDNKGIHNWDAQRLWRKLKDDGFIVLYKQEGQVYKLSDNGMVIMRKHGTYSNYVKSQIEETKKNQRENRVDRNIRNGNIIAALLISFMTLVLTQCPSSKDKQLKKTEEGIQSVSKKLDSLLQVLSQSKTEIKKEPIKDTATNK